MVIKLLNNFINSPNTIKKAARMNIPNIVPLTLSGSIPKFKNRYNLLVLLSSTSYKA